MHGHRHVDQVAVAEVDLGEAAGALHDDGVVSGSQPVVGGIDGFAKFGAAFLPEIVIGVAIADGPAVQHDLRGMVALGLEQQGIHIGMAGDAGGFGLDGLRPADFQPFGRSKRVQGHVLGLERRRIVPVLTEDAAEGRGEDAFAHVAAGSGKHDRMKSFFHFRFL